MARLGFSATARAALVATSAWVFAFGCGKDQGSVSSGSPGGDDSTSDGDGDAGDSTGGNSADAGSPRGGSAKDAGKSSADSGAAAGGSGNGAGDKPEPKQLLTIDACDDHNPAGLSPSDVDKLKAGGKADGMAMLYPYDQTVFPRGLTAPLLMWNGGGSQAVYVHIQSKYLEYNGCLPATASGQLQLPQDVWDKAGEQTLGATTPFTIELSTLDGQNAQGPIKIEIIIAQATLKGSIYYNSYDSQLGGGLGGIQGLPVLPGLGDNGSVLRIRPGQQAEFFARQGTCTGCHAASANGERLIAMEFGGLGLLGGTNGQVYDLQPNTPANPNPATGAANSAFVGLSPDGSVYLSTATTPLVGPNVLGANMVTLADATLYETDTGNVINGSGIPTTAAMPTFSVNGTSLVFNDLADGTGTVLALMDYDPQGRKASNQRTLYTSKQGYAGWPFLLPDDGAAIFTVGEANDFTGGGAYIGGLTVPGPKSDLMIVDVGTGQATILAQAMGFKTPDDAAQEKTYLPFGAEELHQHYYPTVSPVAAGGYFWVFFDSIRHYGNQGMHRQLWGTAIQIQRGGGEAIGTGLYTFDPSSPAFYVPGQELAGANHRAFTALDPCRADGESCESGIDCCSGFCTNGVCGPPSGCAQTNEACQSDSDCCNGTDSCIGGFCGQILIL